MWYRAARYYARSTARTADGLGAVDCGIIIFVVQALALLGLGGVWTALAIVEIAGGCGCGGGSGTAPGVKIGPRPAPEP